MLMACFSEKHPHSRIITLPFPPESIAASGREDCRFLRFVEELHYQADLADGEADVVLAFTAAVETGVKLRVAANPAVQLVHGRTVGQAGESVRFRQHFSFSDLEAGFTWVQGSLMDPFSGTFSF